MTDYNAESTKQESRIYCIHSGDDDKGIRVCRTPPVWSEKWRHFVHADSPATGAEVAALIEAYNARTRHFDVVFDGPPSHESGRFVEVENEDGASIRHGEWINRGDGFWALRFPGGHP